MQFDVTVHIEDEGLIGGDVVPPVSSITSGPLPGSTTNDKSPSFAFSADKPGSTFQCRLDGPGAEAGSYSDCTSPQAYADLADGAYTFTVRATDAAENVEQSPPSRSFTIDTVAPVSSISSGPPQGSTSSDTSPAFDFVADETGSSLECKLDGPGAEAGSYSDCTSPQAYTDLADGAYTFTVRATDAAENVEQSPPSRSFTIDTSLPADDTTPPITTIASGPAEGAVIKDSGPTFAFTANEPATFECTIDLQDFGPCSSPLQIGPLVDGTHSFSVQATDLAGNEETQPPIRSFQVDLSVPPPAARPVPPPAARPTGKRAAALKTCKAKYKKVKKKTKKAKTAYKKCLAKAARLPV